MIRRNFRHPRVIQPDMKTFRLPVPCRAPLWIFSLALLVSEASGATVVSGRVRDEETGAPLFPATIRVGDTNVGTVTNPDGRFEISVPRLPVDLLCSHIGYRSDSLSVTSSVSVLFSLIPVTYEMEELVVFAEDPAASFR